MAKYNQLLRNRTRHDMHHDPQYYRVRNYLVDFLVTRSKLFQAGGAARLAQPAVVRPGLEGVPPALPPSSANH